MTKGENFIFIYLPKTGSSFTLSVFNEINKRLNKIKYYFVRNKFRVENVYSNNVRDQFFNANKDQHTTVSQINNKDLIGNKLYSIIRNPFYGYISRYEYKHYANPKWKNDKRYAEIVLDKFPNFPNMNFKEFLDFSKLLANDNIRNHIDVKTKVDIGPLSLQFIQMFAYDPKEFLSIIDFDIFNDNEISLYFPKVTFLNNENLSLELFETLNKLGYSKRFLKFILNSKKKNVSVKKPYNTYLDDSIKSDIIQTEWFLFDFFSDRSDAWIKAINIKNN